MWLFGCLPLGKQSIRISRRSEGNSRVLGDNGTGGLVKTWDHVICIEPVAEGLTRYSDSLDIRAGWLTLFIWMFAQIFYRHRQRRWRTMVKGGFVLRND